MHPRHRIDPDSWSIVMDYLCPHIIAKRRRRLMHCQLDEFSYLLFENENLVCDILGGKRSIQPSLCSAYEKLWPTLTCIFTLREVAQMSKSDIWKLWERLPVSLSIAVHSLLETNRLIHAVPRDRKCKLRWKLRSRNCNCIVEIRHDGAYFE